MTKSLRVLLLALALPGCGLVEKCGSEGHRGPAQAVDPIPFEKLIPLLPRVEGFEAKPPRGDVTKVGEHETTAATGSYEKRTDEKLQSLEIKIRDGAYVSSIYAPFAVLAHSKQDGTDVHRMSIEVQGHPGVQEWDTETHGVHVALIVARRFIVTLKGSQIPPGLVKPTLESIDLKTLASWAGPSPGPK